MQRYAYLDANDPRSAMEGIDGSGVVTAAATSSRRTASSWSVSLVRRGWLCGPAV